ncbi:unnamed protein product [Penicillium roqueforti FM164]|uniref:Genomic scaffold, ProqFM164S01 n=1 Tax=Penicillium roqueforti (strain FM164) TaxID=1365484 RepID=W6PYE4_PENRF|nr:unnamed protein product [Penicillium roqueforti FM164]
MRSRDLFYRGQNLLTDTSAVLRSCGVYRSHEASAGLHTFPHPSSSIQNAV